MSKSIFRKDLAERMSEEFDITKKDATSYLNYLIDEIISEVNHDNEVELTGFGKFYLKERAGKKGVIPNTTTRIDILPSKTLAFKPSRSLKIKGDKE
ncbi:MAG: HU family DNA-binding protein [Erysipelotrichaceae bacterium]|nr:HU family DNA-binding protein [Erysipelotrichaceae bacterium]MBQ4251961.1 HU family DNA-binding protein [Erysipelotrichaceae bacterium]MBQ7223449.1 HU family DNA-binding protein [Erysipelotrichaceae bacterium]